MRRGAALAALVLVPAALVGCSSDGDDPRTPAIENVASRVIVPAYEDAATSSTALAAATNAFCAQPSPSSLAKARVAWRTSRQAWARTEPFGFGPAAKRRSESFISAPADPGRIAQLLGATTPITATSLSASASSVRGFGAIEVVLFASAAPAAIATSRGCAYLSSATSAVTDDITQLRDDWTKDRDGGEPPFAVDLATEEKPKDAVDLIVGRNISIMERLVDRQLDPARGLENRAQRARTLGEGPAGNQAAVISQQLAAVRSAYTSEDGASLGDLFPEAASDVRQRLLDDLDAAITRAQKVKGALAADPVALTELYEASEKAEVTLTTEVVSALDITVGFSDSDGDGG